MNACTSGSRCLCGKYYSFEQVCVHNFPSDVLDNNIVHTTGWMYCAEHYKSERILSILMLQIITEMVSLLPIFGSHKLH